MNQKNYEHISQGSGPPLLLLHGLFGTLSNWRVVINAFCRDFQVIVPKLPIYEGPKEYASTSGLLRYTEQFIEHHGLKDLIIMGNSLGGHVALLYAIKHSKNVKKLILTGSSGLFENTLGGSFPRRGSYEYIKERVLYTFFTPETVDEDFVREVFDITRSLRMCLRVVAIAKSAQRNNLAKDLHRIHTPTLLIWGLNDTITPPSVAHEFHRKLPQSELCFVDQCSHVPMMEHPKYFNKLLYSFLKQEQQSDLMAT